jgi:integrase
MRVPHYLVRLNGGGFQFRKKIPHHLRPVFGGRVAFKQSLRTHCMDMAKAKAIVLSLRYDSIFSSIGPNMANPSIDDFPHLLKNGADARKYKMKLPDGTEIDANDEADHARAIAFLKAKTACDIDLEVSRRANAEAAANVNAANLAASNAQAAEIAKAMKAELPPASFKRVSVAEVSKLYEEAIKSQDAKEQKQNLKTVSDFANFAKIKYLDETSRPLINSWIAHLRDKVGNGNKTIKNKVEYRLKQFIEWAMGAGYYPNGENPAVGQKSISNRQKASLVAREGGGDGGFSPFTLAELANLMAPANLRQFKLKQDTVWAMLLGVFTGARVSEIGQLYLNDISQAGEIWTLRVDVMNPHQSVKTISSKRIIPIHPTLIEMGFLDRIKALKSRKQTRLFPASNLLTQNGAGAIISSRFGRYLEKLKIPSPLNRKLGFHSLRTTFIHENGQTDFNSDRRRRFVGHEVPGVDFQDYLKVFRPSVLLADLVKYWNPPIDAAGIVELLKDLGPLEQIERTQRQRAKPKPKANTQGE